jgi:hypothetical protein
LNDECKEPVAQSSESSLNAALLLTAVFLAPKKSVAGCDAKVVMQVVMQVVMHPDA